MKIYLNPISPNKIILVLVMMLVLNCGAALAQPQQGLMSRLIEIKYSTELYLTTQIKNETNPAKKDSALALYNTMRWKVDGFVYQLSSVLITKNNPKVFKKNITPIIIKIAPLVVLLIGFISRSPFITLNDLFLYYYFL